LSVDVILPPGPSADGFISASPCHFPTKNSSRLCSGPGLGIWPCCPSNETPAMAMTLTPAMANMRCFIPVSFFLSTHPAPNLCWNEGPRTHGQML
jgi:hypothetical protein